MLRRKNKTPPPTRKRPPAANGARSSLVFSYYTAQPRQSAHGQTRAQDTASSTRRRFRLTRRRFAGALLLVGAAGLLLNAMVVSPEPKIIAVDGPGEQAFLQDHDTYAQAAATLVRSSLFNRNKLTFDTAGISAQMREQFPELAQVSVQLPVVRQQPVFRIQAFTPELILRADNGTFVLDGEGRAFLPGSQVRELEQFELPVVTDESGIDLETEEIALPEREVAFITEVYRQFTHKDIAITRMVLPAENRELVLHVQDAPYVVRFNLYGDAREGAGRYMAVRSYLEQHDEQPQEYVDVRVKNRAYYQ